MILNRNYYSKIPFWKAWWFKRQVAKFTGERIFKSFKLFKTDWPNKLYFYSPRLKGKPRFIGTKQELSMWKESQMCETICPTDAIQVTADAIMINSRGCIGCGLCVEFAPAGLLEMAIETPSIYQS